MKSVFFYCYYLHRSGYGSIELEFIPKDKKFKLTRQVMRDFKSYLEKEVGKDCTIVNLIRLEDE